jgi:hypothetical protein
MAESDVVFTIKWRCNAFRVVFADDGECAWAEKSECGEILFLF